MKPILFIHGFGGDRKQYKSLIQYFKRKGINNFYEFNYDNKFGLAPIKVIAKELSEFIGKNIKEDTINIVAISQGGIIALAYLKYYLPEQASNIKVDKLFTLCSPHRGSKLARIINLPGLIDLQPNSNLLKELENFIQENKINVYSIYTPFDLMVFPGWNAKSKYGKNKIIFAPAHPLVFLWPSVKRFIYKNLDI
ncbi:MAG: hypothetical protein WC711_00335 [Candidatus Staskawiczbacteria bacterium]|jgi:triacylglycerol lipase